MGSKANYLENKVLDSVLGNQSFPANSTVYVALFTITPSDAGGGTEVTGGSYARVAVANNLTNFPAASGGSKSNGTDVTFVEATANWGTIVAFGIFDAASGGNLLYWGAVSPNKTINTGMQFRFPASTGLTITED